MFRDLLESKEDILYKRLENALKKEGLSYKKDTSKVRGLPRFTKNGYSIGSGTVFHDQYTVTKDGEEVLHTAKINELMDYVLDNIENVNENVNESFDITSAAAKVNKATQDYLKVLKKNDVVRPLMNRAYESIAELETTMTVIQNEVSI